MRLGILDQPLHGTNDILLGRDTQGIVLVICKDDHVLAAVAVLLVQEDGHVGDIVDAAVQGIWLSKVIDADE